MHEITKITLDNEMDLILAHKQSMRFAELVGMQLAAQTSFATAVSEVCRTAIGRNNTATLSISVSDKSEKTKYIRAVLYDSRKITGTEKEDAYRYARRLVQEISVNLTEQGTETTIAYRLPVHTRVDDILIEKWRINLNTDPALSPYEEIKRKNRQLQELAEQLRESEQRYKSLTDSLPLMIFSAKGDGQVTFGNHWLLDYTGNTMDQINMSLWKDIVHPDDLSIVFDSLDEKYAHGDTFIPLELRIKEKRSGEYRWHTGAFIAMQNEAGGVTSWNAFMVDIEARKQMEQALKDNKELKETQGRLEEKIKELNDSNMQLAQFAYIASHDLQEPLRKISFYSDMLSKRFGSSMPPEAVPFFGNLISATERMKNLIHDVLTYSTVERALFVPTDLNNILKDTLDDLEITISEKNALIKVDNLPVIECIPTQIRQVFDNLISNALKFQQPGIQPQVVISATVCDGILTMSFSDNGIGFEEKYMHRMFDLFQKLHSGEKYKGTGIGLALCKKIMDIHKGSINASSHPGEGATFLISLPLKQID